MRGADLYRTLGRLLVRKGKVAGLYIPFEPNLLESGIYELRTVMGELVVARIGDPVMRDSRYQGISLAQLLDDPAAAMTAEEWERLPRGKQ